MRKIAPVLFILFTFIPSVIFADTIYLKNGRSVYGKIIRETEKGVHLRIPNGEVFLHHADIKKIEKDTEETEEAFDRTKPIEKKSK